jgi:phosphoenolpyruvate carboxykinase (ATP)
MLGQRLAAGGAQAWLVNTGWTGGPFGTGHRIAIADSRAIVAAILEGGLATVPFEPDPWFGVAVPKRVPGVAQGLLDAKATWPDPDAYDRQAAVLAGMFRDNFEAFAAEAPQSAKRGGPPAR